MSVGNRYGAAARASVFCVLVAVLAAAALATWIAWTFPPDDPARFLAALRTFFPSRQFSYLADPRNVQRLIGGIRSAAWLAWGAAAVGAVLFRPAAALLARIYADVAALPPQLRADVSKAWQLCAGERWTAIALVAIVAAGSVVRAWYIGADMNCDELMRFFDTSYHGPVVTTAVFGQDAWHTYSNQLMWLGWKLFGLNHWGIRAHSLTAGCLLIALTFVAAAYFYNRYVALIAASIVSASVVLIAYSVYARSYIHIPFLGLLTLMFVHRGLWAGRTAYIYIAGVLTALGFYALPTMSVFFAVSLTMLAAHVVMAGAANRAPVRVYLGYPAVTAIVTAMLYLPFVVVGGFAHFINALRDQSVQPTLMELAHGVPQAFVLYSGLLPDWSPSWLVPTLVVAGAAVAAMRPWRGRAVLASVLIVTALAAWAGIGFTWTRLYSFLIPVLAMAVGVALVEGWSALWRARGQTPRGLGPYATAISLVIVAVGLVYSADIENTLGAKTDERIFHREQYRLITPNARGVDAMVDYLHEKGLLRPGVLMDTDEFVYRYPIRFALIERGYADADHFSEWHSFPDPAAIYQVYDRRTEPPAVLSYGHESLQRVRVVFTSDRSKLVEFRRDTSPPGH
jgi:hypothetical protein